MGIVAGALIAVGLAAVIVSLAADIAGEHGLPAATFARDRFTRDAALFGARLLGALLILFGAVFVIAARHYAQQ